MLCYVVLCIPEGSLSVGGGLLGTMRMARIGFISQYLCVRVCVCVARNMLWTTTTPLSKTTNKQKPTKNTRRESIRHLNSTDAEGPNVSLKIVVFLLDDLRGHVSM